MGIEKSSKKNMFLSGVKQTLKNLSLLDVGVICVGESYCFGIRIIARNQLSENLQFSSLEYDF